MAVDVSAELVIDRPPGEVARFAIDPAHDAAWIGGVVAAEPLDPPPLAVGSRFRRTAKFLGRRFDYVTEVVALSEPSELAMTATSPFPMTISYQFEENGGGTLARIRVQGEGSGFFRLAQPLLAGQVRRNVAKDLARLKALLEDGGASESS